VQRQDNNEQDLGCLGLGCRQHGVQVPQQKGSREGKAEGNEGVVENCIMSAQERTDR
jgi:hypothetical protein